jgi:hypothetical protein
MSQETRPQWNRALPAVCGLLALGLIAAGSMPGMTDRSPPATRVWEDDLDAPAPRLAPRRSIPAPERTYAADRPGRFPAEETEFAPVPVTRSAVTEDELLTPVAARRMIRDTEVTRASCSTGNCGSSGCSSCGSRTGGGCSSCGKKGWFGHRKDDCYPAQGFGCDREPCPCPPEEVLSYYRCNHYGYYPTLWRPWPEGWLSHRPTFGQTYYDRYRPPTEAERRAMEEAEDGGEDNDLEAIRRRLQGDRDRKGSGTDSPRKPPERLPEESPNDPPSAKAPLRKTSNPSEYRPVERLSSRGR